MLPRSLKPFLLIGSAKSGTTSLFSDICEHPDVFLSPDKEPGYLLSDKVLTPEGYEEYVSLFDNAPNGTWVGDATTFYTSRDKHPGVPERAKAVLGPDIKILFVGRDPVERLKSHYRQRVILGRVKGPLQNINLTKSDLLLQSKYDYQLDVWFREFPREQFMMVTYEDYVRDPEQVVRRIWEHLGLPQVQSEFGKRKNISKERYTRTGIFSRMVHSKVYKQYFRNVFSSGLKEKLKAILLNRPEFIDQMSDEKESKIRKELIDNCQRFYEMSEKFK